MTQHTPGPWTQHGRHVRKDNERCDIPLFYGYEHLPEHEGYANAHLIAAAPDLYDACQAAVDAWHANSRNFERERDRGTPTWLSACRAAIAKAREAIP